MMRKLVLYVMFLPVVAGMWSCEKEEVENKHPEEFIGTWEMKMVCLAEYNYKKTETSESYSINKVLWEEEYKQGTAPLLILNADGSYEQIQKGEETVTGTWSVKTVKGVKYFTTIRNNTNEKVEVEASFLGAVAYSTDKLDLSCWVSKPIDGLRIREIRI
jgi:hypothetical protein